MLVVCAVKAPKSWNLTGLKDSKKLSPSKREKLSVELKNLSENNIIEYKIVEKSNKEIDQFGLGKCLKQCYYELYDYFYKDNFEFLVDGNLKFDSKYKITSIVKGDNTIPQIMAASILAKTYRDAKMVELDKSFPQYNWVNNKGYLTADHLTALNIYGTCEHHRFSYEPIKKYQNIGKL